MMAEHPLLIDDVFHSVFPTWLWHKPSKDDRGQGNQRFATVLFSTVQVQQATGSDTVYRQGHAVSRVMLRCLSNCH